MSDKDFDLLLKMMGMTGSDNDNQALVALRKANALAAKLGGWEAILRGKVKITILSNPFDNISTPSRYNDITDHHRRPAAPSRPQPPTPPPTPQWPPPPSRPQPSAQPQQAPPQPQSQPKPVVNKYEGTCTTCKGRVLIGQGLAYKSGGRWLTRHNPGQCPTSGTRRVFTADDLQV